MTTTSTQGAEMLQIVLIDGDERIVRAEAVTESQVPAKREEYRRTIRSLWTGNSYQVVVIRIERCRGDLEHGEHLAPAGAGRTMHWCPGGPAPMTRAALADWLVLRGVDPGDRLRELLDRYAGRTEDEMDALYDEQHGSMA